MIDLEPTTRISAISRPLDWTEDKCSLMVQALRAIALFHRRKSPVIAGLYERHGFDPETLSTEQDIARIPALGVSAMKHYLLHSLPAEDAVLKLTSSGTRGQKTQIWFDRASLDRVQSMLDVLWAQEGLISMFPTHYVMVNYDPNDAKDLGVAYSDENLKRFAPPRETFYSIRKNSTGAWEFRRDETLDRLRRHAAGKNPVRVMGMPGFLWELIDGLDEGWVNLPEDSWIFTGGGWKAAEDKQVSRADFRKKLSRVLGVPEERIRDNYGMAEHCAPYIECKRHRFHVPVYNRVLIRDPVTMDVLPPGTEGLMELVTPYNAMMPNLALLTTDLGVVDAEACPCGWNAPTFRVLGRAGLSKHKGCALHASEIVKRSS